MDDFNYDPMVMDGEPEQPQVKISAVCAGPEKRRRLSDKKLTN